MSPRLAVRLAAAARLTLLIADDHHPAVLRARDELWRFEGTPRASDRGVPVKTLAQRAARHALQASECLRCTAPWAVALVVLADRGPARCGVDVLAGALAVEQLIRLTRRSPAGPAPVVVTAP